MAIERVTVPTPTAPLTTTDYQAILAQLLASSQAFTGREIVDGSTIRAGTVMLIGGVLYKATSDTTVSGTTSLYVKITPSGATATAAFVSSLSGVAWNHAYGGYYDGSGSGSNLVVFDEARAVASGVITAPMTERGLSAGPRKRTFTASGTFVVPTGVTEVYVTGCAAGGNGGAGLSSSSSTTGSGSGGGQGESVVSKKIDVTPGESIVLTLGAPGSDTTFGSLLTLTCGVAGSGGGTGIEGGGTSGSDATGLGGKKGALSGAVLGGGGGAEGPFGGDTGGSGTASSSSGGSGGKKGGGGGGGVGSSGLSGGAGGSGNAPGSGGGGGGVSTGSSGGAGGAGGPAIITVEW